MTTINPYLEIKQAVETKDIEPLLDKYIEEENYDLLHELLAQTLVAERMEYIFSTSFGDRSYLEDILTAGFRGYLDLSTAELLEEFDENVFYFLDWTEEEGDRIVARIATATGI